MSPGQTLVAIGRRSLTEPRPAAADLMALGLPMQAVWTGFFLTNILGILVSSLLPGAAGSPFLSALFAIALSLGSVVVVVHVGRALGGHGTFADTLLLTTFLSALVLVGQVAQLVLSLVFPPVAGIFGIAVILMAVWLNVNFIAAIHGFSSLLRALGVMVLGSFVLALGVMVVLALTGNLPEPPA